MQVTHHQSDQIVVWQMHPDIGFGFEFGTAGDFARVECLVHAICTDFTDVWVQCH